MNCSIDNLKMDISNMDGKTGWLCFKCKGVWLPSDFVASFRDTHPWFVEDLYERLVINTTSSSERECPEGHGALDCAHYGKVELDWCARCEGVWFDEGELNAVVALASQAPDEKGHSEESWPHVILDAVLNFRPLHE